MPGISRVGVDATGGTITGPGVVTVFVNGSPISIIGDSVAPHGLPPHASATMVEGSLTVFAGGVGVVREGDLASCNHAATGSLNVFAN